MYELNDFEKEMSKHLKHLLDDESINEDSLNGETISDGTWHFIDGCQEFELEDEVIAYVKEHPNAKLMELWEFFEQFIAVEIVD